MTAHKETPTHTRRRRRGPAHSSGRRVRKGSVWGGTAALAVLGAVAFAAVGWTSAGPGGGSADARSTASAGPSGSGESGPTSTGPTGGTTAHASGSPSAGPSRGSSGSPSAGASGGASGSPSAKTSGGVSGGVSESDIPASGPGTFTSAAGSSAKAGQGTALRYRVDVEDGTGLSAATVAQQVETILADRRGWTADGHSAFRRVSVGAVDFVVRVATPGTVDKICGQYGLETGGEVNCNVADSVMVNLKRWLLATPVYARDVTAYRALIVNHEVGHFLGHNHVGCPGPGKPAPAMMQQIKGMNGCVPNVWPYDDRGRLVTGPAAS